ncbi:hypothetical protein AKJ09_09526 [Labilithrix luteola]|uniref:PepSY domain-containing protein n=1 Tax=Labilithrix luteola TaxID=1391654 RepID=A0A0K1QAV3_9BACT|nr:hypothetical protein AKJ09_09526 [Labilithrix luteola]
MTEEDAVEASRKVVVRKGWRWREPVRVLTYRRGLAGRLVHVVITTANKKGESARVELDALTGALLVADYLVR